MGRVLSLKFQPVRKAALVNFKLGLCKRNESVLADCDIYVYIPKCTLNDVHNCFVSDIPKVTIRTNNVT